MAPVRFRAASLSYMLSGGLSTTQDRWRTAGLAPLAGGIVGAFTMGTMLALFFLTGLGDRRQSSLLVAVGAVAG